MARRAVDQELNRKIILEVAQELFATKGYEAVSMRSIANVMGYSHGSIYYHFKDKAELFYHLVKEDFHDLLRRGREIMEENPQPGKQQIRAMMFEFIRFGLTNRYQYEIMFLLNDPDLQRYSRTEQALCFEMFARALKESYPNGELAGDLLYTLPWNLFMSLHGFITYCIRFNQEYEEVEKLAEAHVDFLLRGIG